MPDMPQLLNLEPTIYATEAYQHLFGKPALTIESGAGSTISLFLVKDEPDTAFTQIRAPFFQGSLQNCPVDVWAGVLKQGAASLGRTTVSIKAPAPIYTGNLEWALPNAFNLKATDTNFHIPITSAAFAETLPPDQRRVLRKMDEDRMMCHQVGFESLPVAYRILARNRAAKGYPLSISLGALSDAFVALPEAYSAYICTKKEGQPMGTAIVVQATPQIAYTFLLGHELAAPYSPILALIAHLYALAQQNGTAIIDLGTASQNGLAIEGLAQFKRSLGSVETYKKTYVLAV